MPVQEAPAVIPINGKEEYVSVFSFLIHILVTYFSYIF